MRKNYTLILLILLCGNVLYAQQRNSNEVNSQKWKAGTPGLSPSDKQVGCDTLNFPFEGTLTLYTTNNGDDFGGYVAGTNYLGDKAKANIFSAPEGLNRVYKLGFYFGMASATDVDNSTFEVAVWDNDGAGGAPGTMLASKAVLIDDIIDDINNNMATFIGFETPVEVTQSFYAGIILPQKAGDTVALLTNTHPESAPGIAWEQYGDLSWHAYSVSSGWNLSIANAVFPVMCEAGYGEDELTPIELRLYPNPAAARFFIELPSRNQARVVVYDIVGREIEVVLTRLSDRVISVDTGKLRSGIYIVKVEQGVFKQVRKITVNH